MAITRIDSQDIRDFSIVTNDLATGSVGPGQAQISGSSNWAFQGGLSGSIQKTAAGTSYIVAGTGISVVSGAGPSGQITISTTGGASVGVSNFIFNEELTGSDGVIFSFSLASTPGPGRSLQVYKNGMRMLSGSTSDYILSGVGGGSGRTVVFQANSIPTSGSNIVCDYMTGF